MLFHEVMHDYTKQYAWVWDMLGPLSNNNKTQNVTHNHKLEMQVFQIQLFCWIYK